MGIRSTSKRLQGGQAMIMFTLMVSSVLVPVVGLAIDGARGYLVRLKLSAAVDGGALAAARLLGTGATSDLQLANAKATATLFVNANFPANFFGANLSGAPTVCVDPGTDTSDPCKVGNGGSINTYKVRTVSVNASATMPTMFMRVLGLPTVTVANSGIASRRDVRVVLVMDRSTSMNGYYTGLNKTPPSINDLALKFVNGFSGSGDLGGRDEVGLVVFGGSAILAYPPRDIAKDYTNYTQFTPPDNNFKASGNIPKYIGDLKDGSNTGTAEALYLAYSTLRADANTNSDLATKLNVIVLFTDGLPNGLTAYANDPNQAQYAMMKSTSGCTDLATGKANKLAAPLVGANNNMIGWFAQHNGYATGTGGTPNAYGLSKPMMAYADTGYTGHGDDIDAYMKNAGDNDALVSQMTGCLGGTNGSPMYTDSSHKDTSSTMAKFPDHDLYGNYTDLSLPGASSVPTGSTGHLYKEGTLWSSSTQCNKASYNSSATWDACQIGLASWQAAAHQAWKIWNQIVWDKASQTNMADPGTYLSQPVIFTIGFNHNPSDAPDMNLLKIIANDPSSPVPFSTRIKGQAYSASDANAVDAAFQQIASEILRLAR